MEDYFLIAFKADGVNYTAKVYPDLEQDGSTFYQVHYDKDKTIFVERSKTPDEKLWKIKEANISQPEVSPNFISHVGSAIESQETSQ